MNPSWVGDGICDDLTNIFECDYDGGDCCLSDIDTSYCLECICHSNSTITPQLCNSTLAWIGDGFCDDETNNEGRNRLSKNIFIKNDTILILNDQGGCRNYFKIILSPFRILDLGFNRPTQWYSSHFTVVHIGTKSQSLQKYIFNAFSTKIGSFYTHFEIFQTVTMMVEIAVETMSTLAIALTAFAIQTNVKV